MIIQKIYSTKIIIIMILVLLCANIFVFSHSVILSDQIALYEKNISTISKQNSKLIVQVYKKTSLNTLSKRAKKLGFVKETTPQYLHESNYAYFPRVLHE